MWAGEQWPVTLHFTPFNTVAVGKDWPVMFGSSHLNPVEDVSIDFFFKIEKFEREKKNEDRKKNEC